MSYDIELSDPVSGECLLLDEPHQMKGGTYCIGGTRKAHLNVTYNYCKHYKMSFGNDAGIRFIYGKTGAESIPVMKEAANRGGPGERE